MMGIINYINTCWKHENIGDNIVNNYKKTTKSEIKNLIHQPPQGGGCGGGKVTTKIPGFLASTSHWNPFLHS